MKGDVKGEEKAEEKEGKKEGKETEKVEEWKEPEPKDWEMQEFSAETAPEGW